VVDVKKIPELTQFSFGPETGLRLGAAVPCYKIYKDAAIAAAYPALTDAARIIGGWQIQSRASIGGNLCNSSPAADSIPALIALGVTCHIAGPDGTRSLPVEQFCTAPGRNVLRQGEFLVSLEFPPPQPHAGSRYQRFIPRNEMDIAVAGSGVWVKLDMSRQKIEAARIALSAVAPTPLFAAEASNWLAGKPATEASYVRAGEMAKSVVQPITDMRGTAEYRVYLVGVLVKRTLAAAVERAGK
jgi:carbon-monoxide dehydrogenase medium subunit